MATAIEQRVDDGGERLPMDVTHVHSTARKFLEKWGISVYFTNIVSYMLCFGICEDLIFHMFRVGYESPLCIFNAKTPGRTFPSFVVQGEQGPQELFYHPRDKTLYNYFNEEYDVYDKFEPIVHCIGNVYTKYIAHYNEENNVLLVHKVESEFNPCTSAIDVYECRDIMEHMNVENEKEAYRIFRVAHCLQMNGQECEVGILVREMMLYDNHGDWNSDEEDYECEYCGDEIESTEICAWDITKCPYSGRIMIQAEYDY